MMQYSFDPNYNAILILGATASGKTKLAVSIAQKIGSQIVSIDSRQVFRRMDIGTGKDMDEYTMSGIEIPVHMIDLVDAGVEYNLYEYVKCFNSIFKQIKKACTPILCGGSVMYIEAILHQYDYISVPVNNDLRLSLAEKSMEELLNILASFNHSEILAHIDISSKKRILRGIEIATYLKHNQLPYFEKEEVNPIVFGIDVPLQKRRENILTRLKQRLQNGLIDEVRGLNESGLSFDQLIRYGLEYKFVSWYLMNRLSYTEMEEKLGIAIQQFAKRQMTYYRKMEREGLQIRWLKYDNSLEENTDYIIKQLYKK
jgi:tRNA dimethylallyltransferase